MRLLRRLRSAVDMRRSALLLGAPGSGKTKVVQSALRGTPSRFIYLNASPILHELLVEFGQSLFDMGHAPLRRFVPATRDPRRWFPSQTSLHLRGILWSALEAEPVIIVLDHIRNASANTYRFLQKVYHTRGVGIIAVSRTPWDLGFLSRLFWDPRDTVTFKPLGNREALQLFDILTQELRLDVMDLDDFRPRVIEAAQGNPGQIVEMCTRAANPSYQRGRHILFAPLRIDTVAHFLA